MRCFTGHVTNWNYNIFSNFKIIGTKMAEEIKDVNAKIDAAQAAVKKKTKSPITHEHP